MRPTSWRVLSRPAAAHCRHSAVSMNRSPSCAGPSPSRTSRAISTMASAPATTSLASAFEDMPIGAQLPVLDESVDIARRFGMAGHLALSLHARADTRFTLGLWEGARRDMEEADELPLAEARQALGHLQFAVLDAAIGDEAAARERIEEGERLVEFVESAPQRAGVALSKTIAHMLLGEPDAAMADIDGMSGGGQDDLFLEWTLAAMAALGDGRHLARAKASLHAPAQVEFQRILEHHLAAVDASLTSRWDDARVEYERATAGYRTMGWHFDAEMTALAFDGYLGARYPEARRAGREAEAWFAERGGEKAVERYRAAFRGKPAPRGTGGSTAHRRRATHQGGRDPVNCPSLRDGQRGRGQVLRGMRHQSRGRVPDLRNGQRGRSQVLHRVRDHSDGRGPGPTRGGAAPGRRPRAGRRRPRNRRAAAGIGPVRGPGGFHDPGRGPGSGGDARAAEPLLRRGAGGDRPVWRDDREVHR